MISPQSSPMNNPETDTKNTEQQTREERFVANIIDLIGHNKGDAASLKRADNPATEYQSWRVLAQFGVDIEKRYECIPFATIAAAIARAKPEQNGRMPLGRALLECYHEKALANQNSGDDASDPGAMHLRRLLACDRMDEFSDVLRPILSLIARKGAALDYAALLADMRWFNEPKHREHAKRRWASQYYRKIYTPDGEPANQNTTHKDTDNPPPSE